MHGYEVDSYLPNGRVDISGFYCPGGTRPVTADDVRQTVIRLLPHVPIGSAPKPGSAWLVQAETIMWLDTTTDRHLSDATVLGRNVSFRIHLTGADWDFGDQTTEHSSTPGRPYDPAGDPCGTKDCPSYFGHTYVESGRVTATATATWTAQFRVGAGAWTDVGPVTGPTTTLPLTLLEAHSVLVR